MVDADGSVSRVNKCRPGRLILIRTCRAQNVDSCDALPCRSDNQSHFDPAERGGMPGVRGVALDRACNLLMPRATDIEARDTHGGARQAASIVSEKGKI
ncbi:MAG: hypothetical protein V4801_02235 [Burkholderia gladioli]